MDEVHLRQVLHAVGDAPHHADQLHDLKKEFEIIFMFYGVFEVFLYIQQHPTKFEFVIVYVLTRFVLIT